MPRSIQKSEPPEQAEILQIDIDLQRLALLEERKQKEAELHQQKEQEQATRDLEAVLPELNERTIVLVRAIQNWNEILGRFQGAHSDLIDAFVGIRELSTKIETLCAHAKVTPPPIGPMQTGAYPVKIPIRESGISRLPFFVTAQRLTKTSPYRSLPIDLCCVEKGLLEPLQESGRKMEQAINAPEKQADND